MASAATCLSGIMGCLQSCLGNGSKDENTPDERSRLLADPSANVANKHDPNANATDGSWSQQQQQQRMEEAIIAATARDIIDVTANYPTSEEGICRERTYREKLSELCRTNPIFLKLQEPAGRQSKRSPNKSTPTGTVDQLPASFQFSHLHSVENWPTLVELSKIRQDDVDFALTTAETLTKSLQELKIRDEGNLVVRFEQPLLPTAVNT